MRKVGSAYAELIDVGVVANPGQVLPDALAQRHLLDVGVLVTEVVRATDVEAGQGGQAAQDGEAGGGLLRVRTWVTCVRGGGGAPPMSPCAPSRRRHSAPPRSHWK